MSTQYSEGKKLTSFKKVELRESEFKKACELDGGEFENIRSEYFKETFVSPLIGIIIPAAVVVLWISGVLQQFYVFSDVINYAIMFLAALSVTIVCYKIYRCIISLVIISKINKQDFYWHLGHITCRKRLWTVIPFKKDHYYIVDDEYCSRIIFVPRYRKGTEVYFLYFPGSMEGSYIGGVVVRKKA